MAHFLQVDPCLQERPSYMGNRTKVLRIPCITVKYAMPKFSKCKILTIEYTLVKFLTLLHRQTFTLYSTYCS